jgi:hypothetical protein
METIAVSKAFFFIASVSLAIVSIIALVIGSIMIFMLLRVRRMMKETKLRYKLFTRFFRNFIR